jgi:hypothetical protein
MPRYSHRWLGHQSGVQGLQYRRRRRLDHGSPGRRRERRYPFSAVFPRRCRRSHQLSRQSRRNSRHETDLDGHSRVKERDANTTRCDLRKCGGGKYSMRAEPYVQTFTPTRRSRTVEGSSRRSLKRTTLSRPLRGLDQHQPELLLRATIGSHHLECHCFYAGFFTNGNIDADGVASIALIGSFS